MISSATKIRLKRSGVPGRRPTLADLQLGELGINYNDGKLFFRQENDEVSRIVEPGQTFNVGRTFFVTVEGNDNNSGLNERDALRSIKAAAIKAQPGDSIKVYPGQYIEDNPITFRDRVSVEGMELRNVLVTPGNPGKDLYQVGDGFHATNHSFVSSEDSTDGAAIITFRPLEGTASDRYFDAARLLRDNLDFLAGEAVGFLTSGFSGQASDQRSQDGARAIDLNKSFLVEETFQYINSPDYRGPDYVNPDPAQCRRDLKDILFSLSHDLVSDGNSASAGAGLTYYAPIKFIREVDITDAFYNNKTGQLVIEPRFEIDVKEGDEIKLADIRMDCPPYGNDQLIIGFKYNNEVGLGTVILPFSHNIKVGDQIKLDGLRFDCPRYGNEQFSVTGSEYDNTDGDLIITLGEDHNLQINDRVELRDLLFDCPVYGGQYANVTDLTYDPESGIGTVSYDEFVTFNTGDSIFLEGIQMDCPPQPGNSFSVTGFAYDNVTGISSFSVASDHNLNVGDTIRLVGLAFTCPGGSGITTTIFPADGDQEFFSVLGIPASDQVIIKVGVSTIEHEYVSGGNMVVGISTNIFPDGARPDGSRFEVVTGIGSTQVVIDIGAFPLEHTYVSGGRMQYGETNRRPVIGFDYNNVSGFATCTVNGQHGLVAGDNVKLDGLRFECVNSPGITTNIFPDGTAASYNLFPVTQIIDENTFITKIGKVAFEHTYTGGGAAFVGVTTNFFPDGTQGYSYTVTGVPASNEIRVNVGVSSIPHEYIRGGTVFAGRSNERDFIDFRYDGSTGLARITFAQAQELFTGDNIKLKGLEFTCDNSTGITTTIFPDNNKFLFEIVERLNPTQFNIRVGKSDINHTWVPGTGEAFVGITTDIFPEAATGKIFRVVDVPAPNLVVADIGISSIPHTYLEGGRIFTGITTDLFPGDSQNSPLGDVFTIESITEDNEIVVNVGVSSIQHNYSSGGKLFYGQTQGGQLIHLEGPGVKEATIAAIDFQADAVKSAINNRPHGSFIAAETALITDVDYDNINGYATITAPGIDARENDLVRLSDIEFRCSEEFSGVTTSFFPDGTRPDGSYFTVDSRIGLNTFTTFVGVSTIVHNYLRGGNAYRYNQSVRDAVFTEATGVLNVTVPEHGFNQNDVVELRDLDFNADIAPDYNVSGFEYDNASGVSTVFSETTNDVKVGEFIKLDGLKFACPGYGNQSDISNFENENTTGLTTITSATPHGVSINAREFVKIISANYNNVGKTLRIITDTAVSPDQFLDDILLSRVEFNGTSGIITAAVRETLFPIIFYRDVNDFTIGNFDIGPDTATFAGVGSATKADKLNVKLEDIRFSTPINPANEINITDFLYDNTTGSSLITLDSNHGLDVGDRFQLADIKFQCPPYGNRYGISTATVNELAEEITFTTDRFLNGLSVNDPIRLVNVQFDEVQTGATTDFPIQAVNYNVTTRIATIFLATNPGAILNQKVKLAGMEYEETTPGELFPYPDGRDVDYNLFTVLRVAPSTISPGEFEVDVNFPNVASIDTIFQNQGTLTTGLETNVFPVTDLKEGIAYPIKRIDSSNQFTIDLPTDVLPVDFYRVIRNGGAFTGITTNIFPDVNRQNSPFGDIFDVEEVPALNQVRLNVGVSSIQHIYDEGGVLVVGVTTNIFPSDNNQLFRVEGVDSATELRINIGASSTVRNYVSGGEVFSGITTNIFPDRSTRNSPLGNNFRVNALAANNGLVINVGTSSIPHTYESGGTITVGVPTTNFSNGEFPIINVIDENEFQVNVGSSQTAYNYLIGGSSRRIKAPVTNFLYDNVSGLATVSITGHRLNTGDLVKLSDIRFDCDEFGGVSISTVTYNNLTGNLLVETSANHGLSEGDDVKLSAIQMDCPAYGNTLDIAPGGINYQTVNGNIVVTTASPNNVELGQSIKFSGLVFANGTFPDGTDPSFNIYDVISVSNNTVFTVATGRPGLGLGAWTDVGNVFVGITTNIFPGNAQNSPRGGFLPVIDTPTLTSFNVNVGTSTIPHNYIRGGVAQPGITTDLFPDGTQGDTFIVGEVLDTDTFQINVGISSIPHTYNSGGYGSKFATYQSRFGQVLDTSVIRVSGDCAAVAARVDELTGITTSIIEKGPDVAPGGVRLDVRQAFYNTNTQELSISTREDNTIAPTNTIEVRDILLQYEQDGELIERFFPDNDQFLYEVKQVLSDQTVVIDAGIGTENYQYVSGGTVAPGIRYDVVAADYDRLTGKLVVVTEEPNGFVAKTGVNLQGLRFSCDQGTKVYPEIRDTSVENATYDNTTGVLQVTTDRPHQLYRNAFVKLEGLIFGCNAGQSTYPTNPDKKIRVTKVIDEFTYEANIGTSDTVHTYVSGGTSDAGDGNFAITRIINPTTFEVQLSVTSSSQHVYLNGGTAASVFASQPLPGINLGQRDNYDYIKRVYLAIAHDITRGGNWKCVEVAKTFKGNKEEIIPTLDFSFNIARCIINNVTWGGVPRGYYTRFERRRNALPPNTNAIIRNAIPGYRVSEIGRAAPVPQTPNSVVRFRTPDVVGQFTTEEKQITGFEYNRFTGIATVTTATSHELSLYNSVRLDGLEFNCTSSPRITTNIFPDGTQGNIFEVNEIIEDGIDYNVDNATYNNVTGELVLENAAGFDIPVGSYVRLQNLRWECTSGGVIGTAIYPSNPSYRYRIEDKPSDNILVTNVGVSTLEHTFVPSISIGGNVREDSSKFKVHVGTVDFDHTYVSGGTVWQYEPFQKQTTSTQVRDLSIQDDPEQFENVTPAACRNVQSAIDNCVGVVTTIIDLGFDNAGISTRYPGNDGRGVDRIELMPSQGVGNIIKGPYIRNCTNFVPKSIGMRMDGFDAEPGDEISNGVQGSSNVDSFTQFNPAGVGCSISNGTYQQLVSIFTICCDEAIVCDSGAQLDLTNSNSSFGTLGLVARGIGDANSKCIDRYTGFIEEGAARETPTIIVNGLGNKRPYDGQGIYIGELYQEVFRVEVTDGGSGYDPDIDVVVTFDFPTGPDGIQAEALATVGLDGEVSSVGLIANGSQYQTTPNVTIAPPPDPNGRRATARATMAPLYYDVLEATAPSEGTSIITFKQLLNNTVSVGQTVFFSRLSLQIASSHSFEYIGAGNTIDGARPSQGGVPIKDNEVVTVDGGQIVYTSTDQAGNFNIGDNLIINQFTGTISGRSFDQSVLNRVTPLIIALDS
jgi:hypothetical protein